MEAMIFLISSNLFSLEPYQKITFLTAVLTDLTYSGSTQVKGETHLPLSSLLSLVAEYGVIPLFLLYIFAFEQILLFVASPSLAPFLPPLI